MRNILLSTVAVLALTGSALAADLPSTKAAPVYVPPAPVFTWTGVYIGVEGGGDFRDYRDAFGNYTISKDAGLVGGVIGYNYQFANNFVIGIEGDAAAVLGGNKAYLYNNNNGNGVAVYNNTFNSDYAAAIRGRLGVAAFNNALLYVAGGVAFGDAKINYGGLAGSYTTDRTGWTIGGGVDYAFTPNWIGRIEYRYVDLGTGGYVYGVPGANGYLNDHIRVQSSEVLAALIYKFGYTAPAPVVAKY